MSEAQRRVLEALTEGEWVAHWLVPHCVGLRLPRYRPLPLMTVTLRALLQKGLLEVRERNSGLAQEWRRTPAGTAALAEAEAVAGEAPTYGPR